MENKPRLLILIVGKIRIFFFHNITTTYTIQYHTNLNINLVALTSKRLKTTHVNRNSVYFISDEPIKFERLQSGLIQPFDSNT